MAVRITPDQIHELEASARVAHERDLDALRERLDERGVDTEAVIAEVQRFSVAAPSWALGTGGTRFGRWPGSGSNDRCNRRTGRRGQPQRQPRGVDGVRRRLPLHCR